MSKFIAVVITAAICLPLGALLRGEASAERRYTFITGGFGMIEGHPHLGRAQAALYEALARRSNGARVHQPYVTVSAGTLTLRSTLTHLEVLRKRSLRAQVCARECRRRPWRVLHVVASTLQDDVAVVLCRDLG